MRRVDLIVRFFMVKKSKCMDKLTLEECGYIFWLAARDIVFLSMYEEKESSFTNGFSIAINCNDTFYYACSDAEDIAPNKAYIVKLLFDKFGWCGVVAYAALKRGSDVLKELQTDEYFLAIEYIKKENLLQT
jgi:hypothetical protein